MTLRQILLAAGALALALAILGVSITNQAPGEGAVIVREEPVEQRTDASLPAAERRETRRNASPRAAPADAGGRAPEVAPAVRPWTVRLIIEGLSPGESADYIHRLSPRRIHHGAPLRLARGSLPATSADPRPSTTLRRPTRETDAAPTTPKPDQEEILVSAPGYGSRGFTLEPGVDLGEIVCELVPSQPLRVEFPRLAGLQGHLSATLTWSDPAGAVQQSGIHIPNVRMEETHALDPQGHATFEATLVPSHPILHLHSTPLEGGHDRPVTIFETSVSVDAQRTALTFEDLEVHLVEFLPPTPGTAFRLQFRPEAPSRISLPEGTRSRGWTNSYGFHGGHRLRSDVRGRLMIYLPPTLSPDARISAAPLDADGSGFAAPLRIFGQHVQGDPEWEGLEPITIETSGAIQLVLEEEE